MGFVVLVLVIGALAAGLRFSTRERLALEQSVTAAVAESEVRVNERAARQQQALDAKLGEVERRLTERLMRDHVGLTEAIAGVEIRLKAEAERQHQATQAGLAQADAAQRARGEALDAALRKLQASMMAIEAGQRQEDRKK